MPEHKRYWTGGLTINATSGRRCYERRDENGAEPPTLKAKPVEVERDGPRTPTTLLGRPVTVTWALYEEALTERDRLREACDELLQVLTEPGVMDVDIWKAWKKNAENRARVALETPK